jgi:hypothetical protein
MSLKYFRVLPYLFAYCVVLCGCSSEPPPLIVTPPTSPATNSAQPPKAATKTAPAPEKKLTYEEMLATIDGDGTEEIKVNRFRSLLSQLDDTYVENKKQISDMTVRGKEILKKEGVTESLLNIMEGMNKIFPSKIENQKYAEYIAAYLTLRKKGQSHQEAVDGLTDLIAAITAQK